MGLFDLFYDDEAPVGNVIATARVGSRVIRCVGATGVHSQLEVANQLDSFLEHIRQQKAEEARRRSRNAWRDWDVDEITREFEPWPVP
jgi:hypothetical protein